MVLFNLLGHSYHPTCTSSQARNDENLLSYDLSDFTSNLNMDVESAENSALFRPAKRRKFQRGRRSIEDGDLSAELAPLDSLARDDLRCPSDDPALTQILRQRKNNKNRRHGIEFSTVRSRMGMDHTMSNSLATIELKGDRLKAISDRFVGHTGQVVDVDKHMFAHSQSLHHLQL